ncbi:MAG: MATE family efflux transporter [Clostridia bacterium]|nr:MATE family efflux transporter [Clostridia bacterium]
MEKTEKKEFYKKLLSLTLPLAFQSLMLASVAAADAFMLGRIDQDAMSSVSLASQIQFVQNMVITSVTGAGSILGAQYWGKNDKKTINDIFCLILRLNAIVCLLFFVGCVFFPRILMFAFAHETTLLDGGAAYLRIAGWSYLLTGISQCYLSIMRISGHAGRSAWISSGAVVLNIGLNAVFIFGLFGVSPMSVKGAALATLISRVAELICAVGSSFGKTFIRPDLKRLFFRDKLLISDFRKCCLPVLGASLLWGVGFTSYTSVMGHLGGDAAAANSVTSVVRDLMCCACNGIASAGGIIVGNKLGEGDLKRGREYGDKLLVISVICGLITMVVILALIPLTLLIADLTDTARYYLTGIMVIMAVYMIGRCINTIVINGVFAAGGDTKFDMYSLAVAMWGFAIPLAFLSAFVFGWHIYIVYAFTCIDELIKLPWVFAHFRKHKWVKDLTRERN